jgi:hypothetical protein
MPEYILKARSDTPSNWAAINPVLAEREMGWIVDGAAIRCKRGDGVTAWNDLPELEAPAGPPGPSEPLATPTLKGSVPPGGSAGQVFRVNGEGTAYGFEDIGVVDAEPDTVVKRGPNGELKSLAPIVAEDVATKGYADGISLGVGQTWQNVTASRAMNTTYTNTTGKPIAVIARLLNNYGFTGSNIMVGGLSMAGSQFGSGTAALAPPAIVPPGETYGCFTSSNFTVNAWYELR